MPKIDAPASTGRSLAMPWRQILQREFHAVPRMIALFCFCALGIFATPADAGKSTSMTEQNAAPASQLMSPSLVMIDSAACPYCARWRADIGGIYGKTSEGRFAPLSSLDITLARHRGFKRLAYTPTFLVINKGHEVGRITGYPGPDFFWFLLDEILVKSGYRPDNEIMHPTQ